MKTWKVLWIALIVSFGLGLNNANAEEGAKERPILAIWRDSERKSRTEAPYLRIALWKNGRVLFARNPGKWSHELLEGQISAAQINELRKSVEKTGVFELKGNCYLVPDAPVDCILVDFGGKQQMLYWDEVETPGYGINIAPKSHHKKFMKCWKEVNKLALKSIPTKSSPFKERFQRPPTAWRLKKAIQSE